MHFKIDFSLLSRFRSELMGLSILGIMLAHLSGWMNIQSHVMVKFVDVFSRLSHTEGFLLLSGLGLYYSLSNRITPPPPRTSNEHYLDISRVKKFYIRRFWRLMAPFALMSFPFYFVGDLLLHTDLKRFLLDWSTLYFWFYGNNGMWYISVSIVFYALFPLVYKVINDSLKKLLICILVVFTLLLILRYASPDYYKMTELGITKFVIFVIGCYFGYLSKNKINANIYIYYSSMLAIMACFFIGKKWDELFFQSFYETTLRLMTIPLCCICFLLLSKCKQMSFVGVSFRWLGKYSLELYVLHMLFKGLFYSDFVPLSPVGKGYALFFTSLILCCPVHVAIARLEGLLHK